jgi:hypothetical protein
MLFVQLLILRKMKKVKITKKNSTSTLHKLPFHIQFEGKSNEIEKYFEIRNEGDLKISSFRGRPLRGQEVKLPKNSTGFVFEQEEENVYKTTHEFDSLSFFIFFFNIFSSELGVGQESRE